LVNLRQPHRQQQGSLTYILSADGRRWYGCLTRFSAFACAKRSVISP
jgi:hypothetical protein